jgi:hypothetical protein
MANVQGKEQVFRNTYRIPYGTNGIYGLRFVLIVAQQFGDPNGSVSDPYRYSFAMDPDPAFWTEYRSGSGSNPDPGF